MFVSAATLRADKTSPDWSLRPWQSDDGLPNNIVTDITQTKDGYLWIASPGPLARFDGVQFEYFSPSEIAAGSQQSVRILIEGRNDDLWLGLLDGSVMRVRSEGVQIFTNNLSNPRELVEDSEGVIWVNYDGGRLRQIKNGVMTNRFPDERWLEVYNPGSLVQDVKGHIWFAKGSRISKYQSGQLQVVFQIKQAARVTRLAAARDGGLWICSGARLFKYNDETNSLLECGLISFPPGRGETEPTAMLEDHEGNVWIGTSDSGLFVSGKNGFESVPTSHPEISSLMEDREGNIWVGTVGGGLNRIQRCVVRLENMETGLPFDTVRSICEDSQGTAWVCTQNGLLACRTPEGWSPVTNIDWQTGSALCVASDPAGGVWVGTRNKQLHYWRDGHWTMLNATNGLIPMSVHALLVSRSGDLWIGGNDPETLQTLHHGQWRTFPLPADARYVRAMTEDVAGNIWVGTSKGYLFRVTGDTLTDETVRTFGLLTPIRALHATPDGSVWIATGGSGLGWIDRTGHFLQITTKQGLYDDYLSQVISDERGWLWFGADRGIFKVRQIQLEGVGAGKSTRIECIHYGESIGLPSLQANFGETPGAGASRDGHLWMPMRTAMAVINPANENESNPPPAVLLTQVLVDEKTVASFGNIISYSHPIDLRHSSLHLKPAFHRLEFDYTSPGFSAPENFHFRYRLDDFDEKWIEARTARSALYSRLPAGDYRFRVEVRSGDGPWSDHGAMMTFRVEPFFWQTWWFRIAALAIFAVSTIVTIRHVSLRRLRRKLQVLEREAALGKERARIARDLHDDLGGSLTQVTMLLEVALRQNGISDAVGQYVRQGLGMTRQGIKSLDETVWAVNPRNDTISGLVNYIGQFAVEFLRAAGIRCYVDLLDAPSTRTVSAEMRHHIFLAVKEALNNIVRHAGATTVSLRAIISERSLTLMIEDDGHGFEQSADDSCADGLRNMKQRLEEIGGTFQVESRSGKGTRIIFICPWPKEKPASL